MTNLNYFLKGNNRWIVTFLMCFVTSMSFAQDIYRYWSYHFVDCWSISQDTVYGNHTSLGIMAGGETEVGGKRYIKVWCLAPHEFTGSRQASNEKYHSLGFRVEDGRVYVNDSDYWDLRPLAMPKRFRI